MARIFFITGCIASGKSKFMQIAKNRGFETISADEISHKILSENSAKIAQILKNSSFLKDGKIDRKMLGNLVFSDKNSREILENFMHPKIRAEILAKIQNAANYLFIELPLFFESKSYENLGTSVLIYAPKELCMERLMKRNGLNKAEAALRLNAQLDIEKKRALADIIIDNSKDLPHFEHECESFFVGLK